MSYYNRTVLKTSKHIIKVPKKANKEWRYMEGILLAETLDIFFWNHQWGEFFFRHIRGGVNTFTEGWLYLYCIVNFNKWNIPKPTFRPAYLIVLGSRGRMGGVLGLVVRRHKAQLSRGAHLLHVVITGRGGNRELDKIDITRPPVLEKQTVMSGAWTKSSFRKLWNFKPSKNFFFLKLYNIVTFVTTFKFPF